MSPGAPPPVHSHHGFCTLGAPQGLQRCSALPLVQVLRGNVLLCPVLRVPFPRARRSVWTLVCTHTGPPKHAHIHSHAESHRYPHSGANCGVPRHDQAWRVALSPGDAAARAQVSIRTARGSADSRPCISVLVQSLAKGGAKRVPGVHPEKFCFEVQQPLERR